jgi:hypothetical protein
MKARQAILVATAAIAAIFGGILVLIRWDDANKIAETVSAIASVTAVGVAIWAALPGQGTSPNLRVSRTGSAWAGPGGQANTGISGSAPPRASMQVHRTGRADASREGDANSGIHTTDSREPLAEPHSPARRENSPRIAP